MNGTFDTATAGQATETQQTSAQISQKDDTASSNAGQQEAKKPAAKSVKKNVYQKLMAVQQNLKAHKGQHNDYGNYNYRSAEDILEAVKPLLLEQEAIILINDEIFNLNDQVNRESKAEGILRETPNNYIKATVTFIDCESGKEITASAFAKECQHTGMSADQCTGCASSYARKYALNALLCIDNTADSDSNAVAELERKAQAQAQQNQQNSRQNQSPANAPAAAARTWGRTPQQSGQSAGQQGSRPASNTGWGNSGQRSGWGQKAANG